MQYIGPAGIISRPHPEIEKALLGTLPVLLFMLFAGALQADPSAIPRLIVPLDCDMRKDCSIQNHFDNSPGKNFLDYQCGSLGYDGHNGTDFRLPNLKRMKRGVPVVAAAGGRVRAVRDEMPDISIRKSGQLRSIKGREAGNSVAVMHGAGWETQYSHLQLGSIRVRPGQEVKAGQVIGLVGLSGKTEFPHVHLSVRYKGRPVDPFKGLDGGRECGPGKSPLWTAEALSVLEYKPTGVIQAGFAGNRPSMELVEEGKYSRTRLPATAPALAFWVEIFGAKKGDRESIRINTPDGSVLARKRTEIPKEKARWFTFVGKKRRRSDWPTGTYRATYRLEREQAGKTVDVMVVDKVLEIE